MVLRNRCSYRYKLAINGDYTCTHHGNNDHVRNLHRCSSHWTDQWSDSFAALFWITYLDRLAGSIYLGLFQYFPSIYNDNNHFVRIKKCCWTFKSHRQLRVIHSSFHSQSSRYNFRLNRYLLTGIELDKSLSDSDLAPDVHLEFIIWSFLNCHRIFITSQHSACYGNICRRSCHASNWKKRTGSWTRGSKKLAHGKYFYNFPTGWFQKLFDKIICS